MNDLLTDLENLAQKHIGKIMVGGGSTVASLVLGIMLWFANEYQDTETRSMLTQQALDAHTAMERENYASMMEMLDGLQSATGEIQSDLKLVKYRLNTGQGRMANTDAPAPLHVTASMDDNPDGMQ